MTVKELRALLKAFPPQANVLIDVKPWDEALNLTGIVRLHGFDVTGDKPFVVVMPSTKDATRLDPNGAN